MQREEAIERIMDGRAWHAFCDSLKEAGDIVFRNSAPATPFDRAEGYRYLTRLLRAGLDNIVEFGDPRFPGFFQLSNETIKIGNDNPDNHYLNSNISGHYEYRITGNRGTVHYLSIGTKAGGYESDGVMLPTGQIDATDMEIADDGTFEIIVSCEEKPGNWLPMTPETTNLIVRETFHDRNAETPATLQIERINSDGTNQLDPAALEDQLLRAVNFAKQTSNIFADWMDLYSKHINELPSDDQIRCQKAGGDAKIHYLQSYWKLDEDEALVVRPERIPECSSWNLQISNYWMESLDYRFHKISINKHTAVVADDGSVTIVVAHTNPGPAYPNWLETTGHDLGGMLFRWIDAEEHPPVHTEVVKLADL